MMVISLLKKEGMDLENCDRSSSWIMSLKYQVMKMIIIRLQMKMWPCKTHTFNNMEQKELAVKDANEQDNKNDINPRESLSRRPK